MVEIEFGDGSAGAQDEGAREAWNGGRSSLLRKPARG
jgi:hypothetical protein